MNIHYSFRKHLLFTLLLFLLVTSSISSTAMTCTAPQIPGGGTITFTSERTGTQQLFVIDDNECNIMQLTNEPAYAITSAWSPDGSKVAYNGGGTLYVMNVDGTGKYALPSPGVSQGFASWSADGSQILFSSDIGWYAIYLVNADGTGLRQLVSTPWHDNAIASFTPDGRIVFLSRDDRGNDGEVWIMDAEGSNRYPLTADNGWAESYPDVSPVDGRIAFSSQQYGNWDIFVMDLDGTNLRRLTTSSGNDEWPRWSPDGTRLTYWSSRDGNWEIYVMYADGTGQTRVTNNLARDFAPDWGGPRINQTPVCSTAVASDDSLWPPNHQMLPVTIQGITDPEGDPVVVTIMNIFQDEPTNGTGDGDTSPDGQGIGTSVAMLRSERAGIGNGRVYHVTFTANDGNGGMCSGEVAVGVPHSQGKKGAAVDDGPLYDSTQP